jgi:hypothetical protein
MSQKFVFYRRTSKDTGDVAYIIKSQLQYGEILGRAHERLQHYEREVLAESDDLGLLYKMKELAQGVDDE